MTAHCCFIYPDKGSHFTRNKPCKRDAVWQIWWGSTDTDYTHACALHVGDMLEEDKENRVSPV